MKKNKYPRPQFERKDWINLNGQWDFEFDDNNIGLKEKWYKNHNFKQKINVPFAFQTKLSGINDTSKHDYVWYQTFFEIPKKWNEQVVLHFGAVDYESRIYINGQLAGHHVGGHDSFSFDITNFLVPNDKQKLVVYVYDPTHEERIPRGKQTWNCEPHAIWYTRTTGIWQTVWLEHKSYDAIEDIRITPQFDNGSVLFDIYSVSETEKEIRINIFDGNDLIISETSRFNDFLSKQIKVWGVKVFDTNLHHHGKSWTPESPFLYDVVFEVLIKGKVVDSVKSYFGMRKIHTENGLTYLNNRPYYFKLVLDQGYYPESLMTAPSDEDLIQDIVLAKEMGFNGCRKHQKVEEARFMYHADRLGYLVWAELPSTAVYDPNYNQQIVNEWLSIIKRDYSSPSLIAWVPLNESWGVSDIARNKVQQHYSQALYHLTKSVDINRLVISNDGWEQTHGDICAIHNYSHGAPEEVVKGLRYKESLSTKDEILNSYPAGRLIYAEGYKHQGEPILLTEFGGISFVSKVENGWGYTTVDSEKVFLDEYKRLITNIRDSEVLAGYCYTQLTDVESEVNGLLTYDRKPKTNLENIKKINDLAGFMIPKKIK